MTSSLPFSFPLPLMTSSLSSPFPLPLTASSAPLITLSLSFLAEESAEAAFLLDVLSVDGSVGFLELECSAGETLSCASDIDFDPFCSPILFATLLAPSIPLRATPLAAPLAARIPRS